MMKKRVFIRFMSSLLSAGMIANLSTGYECLKLDATESNMNSKNDRKKFVKRKLSGKTWMLYQYSKIYM